MTYLAKQEIVCGDDTGFRVFHVCTESSRSGSNLVNVRCSNGDQTALQAMIIGIRGACKNRMGAYPNLGLGEGLHGELRNDTLKLRQKVRSLRSTIQTVRHTKLLKPPLVDNIGVSQGQKRQALIVTHLEAREKSRVRRLCHGNNTTARLDELECSDSVNGQAILVGLPRVTFVEWLGFIAHDIVDAFVLTSSKCKPRYTNSSHPTTDHVDVVRLECRVHVVP